MKSKLRIATLAAGLMMAVSMPAMAQDVEDECSTDADCPDNFACETVEWGACPSCVPGEECPPCETGSQNVCVPPPPQECDADNPCSGDDVCVTYTFETCSGGGSTEPVPAPCDPDDSNCTDTGGDPDPEPPPEPDCETTDESYCVPPYLAPCAEDADCGAGFTCEAVELCGCSTDAAPGPNNSSDPPEGESCVCEPTGESYCQLIEVECTSDSDCVGDLTCQDAYGGEERPAIDCVNNGTDCAEPEPVDPVSYCAPPDFGYYGGATGGGYGETVAEATGRDDADVKSSEREAFFPVDGTDGDGSSKESPSSCSTASGGSGGSLLLLLAGLLLGRRRRRF